jgi:ParB family chromosome partitioning protein
MSKNKLFDMASTLPSADDLFSTEEERQEATLPKIYDIPLADIDDFPNHPFKVRNDEDMENLTMSIRERGVITPVTVRRKGDRYEMISGHRRKRACELIGLETLRCEIVELSDEEATIRMCESNFQRSVILPSEKAFSYKMRMDALNKQGKRTDLTLCHGVTKLDSAEKVAESTDVGKRQIFRYIRLTNLIPELLDLVDTNRLKLRPAVGLSYLDAETQREILKVITESGTYPTYDQASRIRKAYEADELNISEILAEDAPNPRIIYTFQADRLRPFMPKDLDEAETEDFVLKALEHYCKYLQRKRSE